jgi:hypothetical protein
MWLSLLHTWFETFYGWKICFYVKNPIYAKFYPRFMILMASSHIYMFCFLKLVHVPHIYIYILLAYTKIRWISNFLVVSKIFGTAKLVFTEHVWPMDRTYLTSGTCPAPIPDMSGSQVSAYILGVWVPLRTLTLQNLSPLSLSCGGQGSPKAIWELLHRIPSMFSGFDSPSPQDLQTLSGSISPKVFSRFFFNFFDLLLIFINVRSPYLGASLGCRNLALNLV